jgi:hypothetical protein
MAPCTDLSSGQLRLLGSEGPTAKLYSHTCHKRRLPRSNDSSRVCVCIELVLPRTCRRALPLGGGPWIVVGALFTSGCTGAA